jgi:hypothetical protein
MKKKRTNGTAIASVVLSSVALVSILTFIFLKGFQFQISGPTDNGYLWIETFSVSGFGSQSFIFTGYATNTTHFLGLGWDALKGYSIEGLIIVALLLSIASVAISIASLAAPKYQKWLQVALAPIGALTAIMIFGAYIAWNSFVADVPNTIYGGYEVYECYPLSTNNVSIIGVALLAVAIFGVNLGGALKMSHLEKLQKANDEESEIPTINLKNNKNDAEQDQK